MCLRVQVQQFAASATRVFDHFGLTSSRMLNAFQLRLTLSQRIMPLITTCPLLLTLALSARVASAPAFPSPDERYKADILVVAPDPDEASGYAPGHLARFRTKADDRPVFTVMFQRRAPSRTGGCVRERTGMAQHHLFYPLPYPNTGSPRIPRVPGKCG